MLQEFLIRSLRRSLDDYNESRIVLGLSRGENLMVSSSYPLLIIRHRLIFFFVINLGE